MMAHAGMPATQVAQTLCLYTNMQRVMKRGKAPGKPLKAYNGVGEGDVLLLSPAVLLVSWQFKMLDVAHPNVSKEAYIDDRNFRGSVNYIVEVDQAVHEFDELAMQYTLHYKTIFLCTNSKKLKASNKMKLIFKPF